MSGWTPEPWNAYVETPLRGHQLETDDVYAERGGRVCRATGDVARSYQDLRRIAARSHILPNHLTEQEREWARRGARRVA